MNHSRVKMSVFLLLLWAMQTAAQFSNVTTCIPQYSWAINSRKQTPCLVAAYLETVCTPDQPVSVPSLPAGNHYLGPDFIHANICICNVVVYSLISACGGCQDRNFTTWGNWSLNCPQSDNKTFPKPTPAAVEIPSWASLDISKTNWTFDPTVAAAAAEISQSLPTTSTSESNQAGTSSVGGNLPTTAEASPSESAATSEKTSHAGAIAGGVVGGIAGIALIALAVFWFFLKHDGTWRSRRGQQRIDLDAEGLQPSSMGEAPRGQVISQSMSSAPRPLSNTSLLEPQSTGDGIFTPVTSAMYTTLSVRNSMESLPFTGSHITRGTYSGAAEI
ncbi:hypothetical protein E4T56_gene11236 [Termitomyces sp. T112]|nr:hypothetical protein E4T56_gene11236 [Termitomyces sp. T112]